MLDESSTDKMIGKEEECVPEVGVKYRPEIGFIVQRFCPEIELKSLCGPMADAERLPSILSGWEVSMWIEFLFDSGLKG